MTREEIIAIYDLGPEAVVALVSQLLGQIARLEERVDYLESFLNKDSHNSSKPPSTDKNKTTLGIVSSNPNNAGEDSMDGATGRKTKSLRKPSDRDPGGQAGHEGHTLAMSPSPDLTVPHYPDRCQRCMAHLSDAPVVSTERRQVYDLPPLKLEVTEHQCHTVACPCCGSLNSGEFPSHVHAPVQYGPSVLSLAVYLMSYHFIPVERTSRVFEDLLGQAVNVSTLLSCQARCYNALEEVEQRIKFGITQSEVVHFDETGFYVNKKREWLHSASTLTLTHYAEHPSRGNKANDAIGILPLFDGTAIHDEYDSYFVYDCRHGVCNGHHLRELTYIEEQFQQDWATTMKDVLCDGKQVVEDAKAKGKLKLSKATLRMFEQRYQEVLDEGFRLNPVVEPEVEPEIGELKRKRGPRKQSPPKNLLDRFRDHRKETLLFMYDFRVPFDNNLAERDLRMLKVQQKISGCFRTQLGASHFCRIRSYLSTVRKQGANVLQSLRDAFIGHPFIPAIPT